MRTESRPAAASSGKPRADAGGSELLQQHGFEIDKMKERSGDIEHRLAGADPGALWMVDLYVEAGAAFGGHDFEKVDRETRRANHRPTHEHRVGRRTIAKA